MANPWTKKNPLMSMWLSGANAVLGTARSRTLAAAKRQTNTLTTQITKDVLNFWMPASVTRASRKKKR